MAILPQGTVTFLFTDIEGSTRLVQELGPRYRDVLERHQALLRDAFSAGAEVGTEGDSFFVAFASATDAVAAAVAGQLALADEAWPDARRVRVRMGLHTGQAIPGPDGYVGFDVHRAARIAAAGYGGQVLLSESTQALVSRDLPEGVTIRDLGEHRLKDLTLPERIFQLAVRGIEDDFPPLQTIESKHTNLPTQLTSFIGRERELRELRALARMHRLVTVIGTGGTGKTRLMLHAAAEFVAEQRDGVWLVELVPITDPELIVHAVARGLGIREDPGRPLIETVIDFLRTKSMLILLDNCEHLIGTVAELVEQFLADCPGVALMATSREALGVSGETVFQVPSLGLPVAAHGDDHGRESLTLDAVLDSEAVRLFVDRATTVLPGFALTPADAPAVVEICRRLDGIPLAIELAAARVPLLSVQEIALRLGDRFRLLTGGRRTALPRQQTLQALIDWSWDLLTDDERRLLRRLSVFAGGCTLEAATAVALDVDSESPGEDRSLDTLDALGRLVGRSLVVVDRGGTTRYHLLETIRQYALEQLLAAEESSEMRDRHLAFFLGLAEEAEPALGGPDMVAWLTRLDADADNLRAALDWALSEETDAAMRLCLALALYWRSRSLTEGFDSLRRASDLARSLPPSADANDGGAILVARVLAAAANASWMAGSASVGIDWARESLRIARQSGDARTLAEALIGMAMTTVFIGQLDGVLEWTDEAVVIAEEIGSWSSIAFVEAGLSQWEVERGNSEAAVARLSKATIAAERSGNPEAIAFTALSHGRVEGFGGRLESARRWFEKAIDGYAQIGDEGLLLVSRSDLAHALRTNGATNEAVELYRETLHGWQHRGNRGAIANQLESVAFLGVARDDHLRSATLLAAAAAIRESAEAPMLVFERAEYDAAVATVRERLDAAEFEAAWADGRRLGTDEAVALAFSVL